MLDGWKTYIIGIIFILYGIFGFIIDLYEGNDPKIDVYLEYILIGLGFFGIRIAIKNLPTK